MRYQTYNNVTLIACSSSFSYLHYLYFTSIIYYYFHFSIAIFICFTLSCLIPLLHFLICFYSKFYANIICMHLKTFTPFLNLSWNIILSSVCFIHSLHSRLKRLSRRLSCISISLSRKSVMSLLVGLLPSLNI